MVHAVAARIEELHHNLLHCSFSEGSFQSACCVPGVKDKECGANRSSSISATIAKPRHSEVRTPSGMPLPDTATSNYFPLRLSTQVYYPYHRYQLNSLRMFFLMENSVSFCGLSVVCKKEVHGIKAGRMEEREPSMKSPTTNRHQLHSDRLLQGTFFARESQTIVPVISNPDYIWLLPLPQVETVDFDVRRLLLILLPILSCYCKTRRRASTNNSLHQSIFSRLRATV